TALRGAQRGWAGPLLPRRPNSRRPSDAADLYSTICRGVERNRPDSRAGHCPLGTGPHAVPLHAAAPLDKPPALHIRALAAVRADQIRVPMHVLPEKIRTLAVRFHPESA